MELRTFVGRDYQETLARIRQELGPEAVILSTRARQVLRSGSTQPRRREVQVTAATGPPPSGLRETGPALAAAETPVRLADFEALREEIRDLKTLLRERQHSSLHRDLIHSQPEVAALYHELARLGVQEPVIAKWLQQVQILLRPDAQKRLGRQAVLHALMQSFSVADPWESAGDGPRCWAFLGTAGVGKTTTLAKLAVVAALARKQRVGLISLDHQRLGAMEQLAAFARLTDLPFLNVHGRTELIQAVTAMHHLDCIFIDTPGRNPHEPILGRELKELLGDLPHLQCHLLISAGAAESLLAATIKGFGALPLASLILAKVDENPEPGGWFNQICLSGLSLSFLTTGPRVPEDLVPASRPLVVSLLLGSTALSQETEVPDTQPCEVNHHAGL